MAWLRRPDGSLRRQRVNCDTEKRGVSNLRSRSRVHYFLINLGHATIAESSEQLRAHISTYTIYNMCKEEVLLANEALLCLLGGHILERKLNAR